MSDISVIGLGSMGTALARTLQQAGYQITVWNRTPEKIQPFVTNGATGASCVAAAVQSSPAILVCIDNYATTRRILGTEDVIPNLAGRVLIQLSTGTPEEARESETWLTVNGGAYIDGAIQCYPSSIGTPNARILVAGAQAAFEACEPLLKCLGGDLRYLGENVGAASALDLAWLSELYGVILGVVHGARLCEAEQVSVALYGSLFTEGEGLPRGWHTSFKRLTTLILVVACVSGRVRCSGCKAKPATRESIVKFPTSFRVSSSEPLWPAMARKMWRR